MSQCSNDISYKLIECDAVRNTKTTMLIWAKKGMATKAMINNMLTGNQKRLQKQIKEGTVKISFT